jgi:hypothetical protein
MILAEWYPIPVWVSLAVVFLLLGGSVAASLLSPPAPAAAHDPPVEAAEA